jgi:ADP-ribose pyrophosphatase YjhB (NUDIX family)
MKSLVSNLYRLVPPIVARAVIWAINASFNVSVAGMFLDDEHRVLLLRHVYRHNYPWGLPGGFVTAGESPAAGLAREILEETGLRAETMQVLSAHLVAPRHIEIIMAGKLDAAAPMRLSGEIFEARFFPRDALPPDMPPAHRACIQAFARSETFNSGAGR